MNRYLKNLNRIEFVVTTTCTGKCKHCCQGEHNSNDKLDKTVAAAAVRQIAKEYNIKSVMTFGGEPLLYPEDVYCIHNAAREMNIPKRQLITNGYFTKDIDSIRLVADKLLKSGINEILLSVDAFHQETIPLKYVIEFAKAVNKESITLKTQPAWLVSEKDNNPYNIKTREILDIFNFMGIETGSGNVIFPSGNALKYLSEYFEQIKEIKNPYEENPADIQTVSFSANGDVLGSNIYKQDIREILSAYSPQL